MTTDQPISMVEAKALIEKCEFYIVVKRLKECWIDVVCVPPIIIDDKTEYSEPVCRVYSTKKTESKSYFTALENAENIASVLNNQTNLIEQLQNLGW